ncbi:tyrosine-type recombinase/integrase [Leptospira bandrabouensis]|uniref:tyrosine-type recombinase/integrase n=1 Tax=Leptospira bandrabouensis TaxID=2484903 RepID=UPI001EE8ABE4|nr:tyrosine-type recombinase/integrase [Leptospira bandrabouensis]MCG6146563.1 tyrosine-type recombinase/integrase [Leptospira bandrabouensis]MCG6161986.1 tyrosine-type recombinase/integrase [Leptospira bandrabouensis]MCG6166170.1 tyrosine-type recombinase/integrase [Leptospira bandrabouensis]
MILEFFIILITTSLFSYILFNVKIIVSQFDFFGNDRYFFPIAFYIRSHLKKNRGFRINEKILEQYKNSLKSDPENENQLTDYNIFINNIDNYIKKYKLENKKITGAILSRFLNEYRTYPEFKNIENLSKLYEFTYFENIDHYIKNENFTDNIKRKIGKENYLTINELTKFFKSFDIDNIYDLQNKLAFELMYSSMFSHKTLLSIRYKDININNQYIEIYNQNTNRYRMVSFGNIALTRLTDYFGYKPNDTIRQKIQSNSNEFVFNINNEMMSESYLISMLTNYLRKSNIKKIPHLNLLRYSAFIHMLENNLSIGDILELLLSSELDDIEIENIILQISE